MTEQERVERLAKWIGFKKHPHDGWVSPDGFQYSIPDLLHDLTTLFKWAKPKLFRWAITNVGLDSSKSYAMAEIEGKNGLIYQANAIADEPAQALFDAIEKLLDMEER